MYINDMTYVDFFFFIKAHGFASINYEQSNNLYIPPFTFNLLFIIVC